MTEPHEPNHMHTNHRPIASRSACRRHRCAPGLTLMELLVAVSLLVILIGAFSMVLVQAQRVVRGGNASIRSNAQATGIMHVLRKDMQRLTQNGFLCITGSPDGGSSRLYATLAGPTPSLTGGATGTGAIVIYGLCDDERGGKVLFRSGLVLNRQPSGGGDSYPADLAHIQSMARPAINGSIDVLGSSHTPSVLRTPPASLAEIDRLWQYLADRCSELHVTWSDGTADGSGNLFWYGPNNPKGGGFPYETGSGSTYRALWTHQEQSRWPLVVKIRFTLRDEDAPAPFDQMQYEVICPVGQ